MIVAQVNALYGTGSTGKICRAIGERLAAEGDVSYILHVQEQPNTDNHISYASPAYIRMQAVKSRLLGNYGFNGRAATKRLIAHLERIRPDVVHLHNMHSHNAHLTLLFRYLKKKKIKVVWTFHDCWTFTSYCPHFIMAKCDKWKTGCEHCPQYRKYSLLFDRSRMLYRRKKELLTGLDMTVVTPSRWLADLVKQSFLKEHPVTVVHNGIDLSVFHPMENSFREKYGIPPEKSILLGVTIDWGIVRARKGLDVFLKLAETLDPDRYQIVLVGTGDEVDKDLPANIISIHRTQNAKELAEIYTASDLFVNPTREEVLGLVNLESLACGTPVLTFQTGGCPECIDETCGAVVPCEDVEALTREIIRICETKPYSAEACVARAKRFDQYVKYEEYIELYRSVTAKP